MKKPRVVIAEDFALIQESIRNLLEPECDVVAVVTDGRAAMDAVATHRPDILLIDVSLPIMNGFVVAQKLREGEPGVKILFLTAHRDRPYVERAFETGAKGYILKSSMGHELRSAIREVVAGGMYRSALLG